MPVNFPSWLCYQHKPQSYYLGKLQRKFVHVQVRFYDCEKIFHKMTSKRKFYFSTKNLRPQVSVYAKRARRFIKSTQVFKYYMQKHLSTNFDSLWQSARTQCWLSISAILQLFPKTTEYIHLPQTHAWQSGTRPKLIPDLPCFVYVRTCLLLIRSECSEYKYYWESKISHQCHQHLYRRHGRYLVFISNFQLLGLGVGPRTQIFLGEETLKWDTFSHITRYYYRNSVVRGNAPSILQ